MRVIGMALAMLIALPAGCAGPQGQVVTAGSTPLIIGMSAGGTGMQPACLAARAGAEDAAAEWSRRTGRSIRIELRAPSATARTQAEVIAAFTAAGVAGIIVDGAESGDPQMLIPAINAAAEHGLPVVCIGTDAPGSRRFAYIGSHCCPN